MSSDETPNPPSREELEEQVIALLMGELDLAATEKIEATMAEDRSLQEFHQRMQKTLGFVQEAVVGPEISKAPTPLKLSDERRDELVAKFKVVELKKPSKPKRRFWVPSAVQAAVIVAIVGILAGMTLPALKNMGAIGLRERRSMESHLSDSDAKEAMYAGLSEAQSELVEEQLRSTKDTSFVAKTEASADEAVPASPPAVVNFVDIGMTGDSASVNAPIDATPLAAVPQHLRKTRVEKESSAPASVALNIVLPEKLGERDGQIREEFVAQAPKYQVQWEEDRRGRVSRDAEKLVTRVDAVHERSARTDRSVEKQLAKTSEPAEIGQMLDRDFTVVPDTVDEQIRKAPKLVGRYAGFAGGGSAGSGAPVLDATGNPIAAPPPLAGAGAGISKSELDVAAFGTMPPAGEPQPLGEMRSVNPPKPKAPPTFAVSGTRLSGFDEAKNQRAQTERSNISSFQSGKGIILESERENALLFDVDTRFDREGAPSGAAQPSMPGGSRPTTITSAPKPTTTFESAGSGGRQGGGGGGGLGGGGRPFSIGGVSLAGGASVQDERRLYKQNNEVAAAPRRKAKELPDSEMTADDSLASGLVTARTRKRGGQVASQSPAQMWGRNQSGQAGAIAINGEAGGQGQGKSGQTDGFGNSADQSVRGSSSSRSRFYLDLNRNAEFKPELELRERELNREMAQKQKAIEGALGQKMAPVDEVSRRSVRFREAETEALAQAKSEREAQVHMVEQLDELSDLQARVDTVTQYGEVEAKQRRLAEQKSLGYVVAGRPISTRGMQTTTGNDDYGMTPTPTTALPGELRAKEEARAPASGPAPVRLMPQFIRENTPAGGEAGGKKHYLWAGQSQESPPKLDFEPPTGALLESQSGAAGAAEAKKKPDVSALIGDATAYYELRQFDEVEKKLNEAMKLDPKNTDAYRLGRLNSEAQSDLEGRARDHTFHERVIEVREAWNKEPAKPLPTAPGDSSGPAAARPNSSHWAWVDIDADGIVRGQKGENTVEDLFMKLPAPVDRVDAKVVADEEGGSKMDFDDNALAIGGDFQSGAKNSTSWMVQDSTRRYFRQSGDQNAPAKQQFGWRAQSGEPADKSESNEVLLRRLNLDVAGQLPSPAATEDFIKPSDGKLSRLSQDSKKRLPASSSKRRVSALRSDLGQTNGVVVGMSDSGVNMSQQQLQKLAIQDGAVTVAGGTEVASIIPLEGIPVRAVTNQFTNLISPPDLVAPGTFVQSKRSKKYYVTNSSVAALLPPSAPATLPEAEAPKPQPKVRPKKPKTLEPKPEVLTKDNAFSTFSLNVSDVAFKLASASLKAGKLPDPETVRSEEFLNALDYHDPAPRGNERLAFAWDRARNPFAHNRDFLRFSIQTAARGRESGQPLNLVVLLDASGSMERSDRLAIVRQMLSVLAGQLKPADRISVVAFARTPWLLVDGMKGGKPKDLLDRVINITPQGGTNIEIGLDLAYLIAHRHYLAKGNNRVIVLTDGAANLGNVDPEALKAKVEEQRKKNIALDAFGVGWEGYNDDLLETLSRNGDGRYGFINDPAEARDGFADLLAGALQVAAANVKAQIEFNKKRVIGYRQIGYTKHQLKKEQFRDNTVDAAEIGAAESGTAMYSIQVDRNGTGPLATVRVRYKIPATGRYVEEDWELPYDPSSKPLESAKPSMRLATVAASFAEWMAANPHAGSVSLRDLERYLTGVPEEFSSDERPKQLRTMLQQARRISGE